MGLSAHQINEIVKKLQSGEALPDFFQKILFPTQNAEYELSYSAKMRKEDILANNDGVSPVPLQLEKVFNGEKHPTSEDGWRNIIAFGDNLQFLKTIYENKDPLIKDKIKGKVKLIYIDPPFATQGDFKASKGEKAYSDKKKGSEFLEFIRRRLILAKEILAPDGSIFVHLDQKMCHHVRIIMDEIFGVNAFQNQIIWQGTSAHNDAKNKYGNVHQVIYWYGNILQPTYYYNEVRDGISEANLKEYSRIELADGKIVSYKGNEHLEGNGNRRFRTVDATWKGNNKQFTWRGAKPNSKREWMYTHAEMEAAFERGELFLTNSDKGAIRCLKRYLDQNQGQILQDIWANAGRMSGGKGTYPTEKPEVLLERIIKSVTTPGDLVMDFFGGSGTTAAVAEKLERRWVTCDIGKLSFYTIQKRILTIQKSKNLNNPNKKYGKQANSFMTLTTGIYDLEKVFNLDKDKYNQFVMDLFEIENVNKTINGIKIDGERKDGYYAISFPYWDYDNIHIDEEYLEDLHQYIGDKVGRRLYIIAPANYVDFLEDYYEIENTRYYFLKVPYQVIKELHSTNFKKIKQPQSKTQVNDLENAIGFHFMKQPEVVSKIANINGQNCLVIKKFKSSFDNEETFTEMENFEALSLVLLDKAYNDEEFIMDMFHFADEFVSKPDLDITDESQIKSALKTNCEIIVPLDNHGESTKIMAIYVDIYGNEFRETFILGE